MGKVKEKDIKCVLIVVAKVIQLINAVGLRKLVLQEPVQIIKDRCTTSQLNLGIILSRSCPQISLEVFRISDLFINNLIISHTFHNHLHHQRCPQSLPLAKVKDSVVISFESITSHQVLQKTTSWRSTSPIPSTTLVHHCLKNVKNLGQHSLIQEQLHQLFLNHLFLTSPSNRNQRPSPVSMVDPSKSWASSLSPSSQERSSFMSTSSLSKMSKIQSLV